VSTDELQREILKIHFAPQQRILLGFWNHTNELWVPHKEVIFSSDKKQPTAQERSGIFYTL
jgi:hypothetical protein